MAASEASRVKRSTALPAPAFSTSGSLAASIRIPRSWRLIGWARVSITIIFIASSLWSVFLGVLNVIPNETVNYVMDTSQYDDGDLWQLSKAETAVMVSSATGFAVISAIYAYLAVLMWLPVKETHKARSGLASQAIERVKTPLDKLIPLSIASAYYELVNQRGRYRKAWNLTMEIPEILFQTINLHNMMEQGLAPTLIHAYVLLMVVNCVYCFYNITIAWKQHAFHEMVGDAVLDVVFAVVFPVVILRHGIVQFRGGLGVMATRQLFFPAASYERRGYLYGDPAQITAFTSTVQSLQVSGPLDLIVTVGFNLITCLRWRRIVTTLRRDRQRTRPVQAPALISLVAPNHEQVTAKDERKPSVAPAHLVPVPHRVVPASVGVLILLYGVVIAVVASMAILQSTKACAEIKQCTRHAFRWYPGASAIVCPCLVYIQGHIQESISKSMVLADAFKPLQAAAEAGSLRTIQIVNRDLQGTLPRNVQRCSDLRQLIIVNCLLSTIPSGWGDAFTKLEYLHITGKSEQRNLIDLPRNLFTSMNGLRALYLDNHLALVQLPSLSGLNKLQTLYLGNTGLLRLPAFDSLTRLRTLALLRNQYLMSLPDLSPLAPSIELLHISSTSVCCSGFLSHGDCNASYALCFPYSIYEDFHSCYPAIEEQLDSKHYPLITNASRAVLQPFLDSDSACNKSAVDDGLMAVYTDTCDGVWFRECFDGICYLQSADMVLCTTDDTIIEMRKTEIHLGMACDPVEEAWLGCTDTT